jgi:PAS domain S-box-containing protein
MQTTVLNVDDNPANRYIRSRTLRGAGFEVIEAGTGQSALKIAREQRPSLLLLDVKLPDMSGLDVCRQLRGDAWAQRIGIIHISATYVDIERESLEAGADLYLAEPVEQTELLSAVRTLVRLRRAEERLVASEERMRLAMEAAGIVTWEIDVATGAGVWGEQFRALLGHAPDTHASLTTWLERVVPSDRDGFRAAIDRVVESGGSLQHEHWIARADNGDTRCVYVHGTLRRSDLQHTGRLIGVALDVTERRKNEAEREQLLQQAQAGRLSAEEAGRVKDEFLAILSHELRTPLTSMLGWIELIRMGRLSSAQQANAFQTIERNARLQISLVNDLLDVSLIVAGKMQLDFVPVRVEQLLASAIDSQRPAAAAKSIELKTSIEPGVWTVRGSGERLEQVFNNLLANAVKFTNAGGQVRVALQRTGQNVRVKVADTGQGISPESLSHLFDRFWQADSSSRRRYGGLGLGLAIVRSLVELHGGNVEAASPGLGHGATFTVTLPLSEAAPAADTAVAEQRQSDSLKGLRILVIDDDADTVELLAVILRAQGASVNCASTGRAAYDMAARCRPDVVVSDLAMPEEDGFSLLKRLRALHGSDAAFPAVAVTGFADVDGRNRALAGGFQAHLAKPFALAELIDLIAKLAREGAVGEQHRTRASAADAAEAE